MSILSHSSFFEFNNTTIEKLDQGQYLINSDLLYESPVIYNLSELKNFINDNNSEIDFFDRSQKYNKIFTKNSSNKR